MMNTFFIQLGYYYSHIFTNSKAGFGRFKVDFAISSYKQSLMLEPTKVVMTLLRL